MRLVTLCVVALSALPTFAASINRAQIQQVISRHQPALGACYKQGLRERPTMAGVVVVRFMIGPDGGVPQAAILRSGLNHAATEQCLVHVFRGMRFPPPASVVHISYPLRFAPTGR